MCHLFTERHSVCSSDAFPKWKVPSARGRASPRLRHCVGRVATGRRARLAQLAPPLGATPQSPQLHAHVPRLGQGPPRRGNAKRGYGRHAGCSSSGQCLPRERLNAGHCQCKRGLAPPVRLYGLRYTCVTTGGGGWQARGGRPIVGGRFVRARRANVPGAGRHGPCARASRLPSSQTCPVSRPDALCQCKRGLAPHTA